MISIQAKKHDNFSVEFKFGFNTKEDGVSDDFSVNAWIFVPNSLDINAENYGKKQFYRDIKSNIRLITPVYLIRDIAQETSLPLKSLQRVLENVLSNPQPSDMDAYEYHLKMFAAIFKSALRDLAAHISSVRCLDSAEYLVDELQQAARRRFYRPEYIACPGCGRTMYNLEGTFNEVVRRTAHLKGMVIAVMGCIVNGPGEMADADWGYVGEGGGKVSIYKKKAPVLRHVPETEAIDRLLELIELDSK
jgi:hypothetical protein